MERKKYRFRCTSAITMKRKNFVLPCLNPGQIIALLAQHGWIVQNYYEI